MEIKQVYSIVNDTTREVLGESAVITEDLSNIVDIGNEVFNANQHENYLHKLIDHVGRMVFNDRRYMSTVPSVLMDNWEYGSILEKVNADMPDAVVNEAWDLVDGKTYNPHVFKGAKGVRAKFFNKYVMFEIDQSITYRQLKSAFSSAQQMNTFISMIFTKIDNKLQVCVDGLIRATINNGIASTIKADYGDDNTSSKSGIKAVNLLYLYNQEKGTSLTKDKCLTDENFLKFASYTIAKYTVRLRSMSTLFNIDGRERFTPTDLLHFVLLTDFSKACNSYLNSVTFHEEYVSLPKHEEVAFWQGTGTDYTFANTSKIKVSTASGEDVEQDGILGVMFDRDAIAVCNTERNIATEDVKKGQFYNYFYFYKAGYFNDLSENFVVFFVA